LSGQPHSPERQAEMSITATIAPTATKTSAQRFAQTVRNIAEYAPGTDTSFGIGAAHVEAWLPAAGTWVLRLVELGDDFEVRVLKTVAVVAAEWNRWDVQVGDGSLILADGFRGIEAALGFALDAVTSPVWAAGVQDQHDAFAC
jgi:hypothetical protein